VRLERVIAAPMGDVFRAFTEPELMVQWFAPFDGMPTTAHVDLRIGGEYRVCMGSRTAAGRYLEISPPSKLVFTWIWEDDAIPTETIVTVALHPLEERTRLVLTHERLPTEVSCMGFEAGWTANLGRLLRLFAQRSHGSQANPQEPRPPASSERS
jgi:uncharacterized protein YndB with AHSA1/START domain